MGRTPAVPGPYKHSLISNKTSILIGWSHTTSPPLIGSHLSGVRYLCGCSIRLIAVSNDNRFFTQFQFAIITLHQQICLIHLYHSSILLKGTGLQNYYFLHGFQIKPVLSMCTMVYIFLVYCDDIKRKILSCFIKLLLKSRNLYRNIRNNSPHPIAHFRKKSYTLFMSQPQR